MKKLEYLVGNFGGLLILIAVLTAVSFLSFRVVKGATNISSATSDHWAWNDLIGWMDFYNTQTVNVYPNRLEGYTSSSAGDISLNCNSTRSGNICAQSNYNVINDGQGNLSGFGWNDTYGWVSTCGGQSASDCPGTIAYRVLIDPSSGTFSGYAWNDIAGWISFNCSNNNGCGTSNYKVITSWVATSTSATLDSTTYDTGVSGGAQLNSITWKGSQPAGTSVKFQLATSNASAGPWNFVGPDGTANTFYAPIAPNTPLQLDYTLHNNEQYFRYRVILISNQAQTLSPRVDDIIVNWSP